MTNRTPVVGFLVASLLFLSVGCNSVHRKILIRSNPEGALVTIDKQPIGHTPVAIPFTYYGTREIQLEMDGFQTMKVQHRFAAPWYQIPPIDLISDNFWPREIRDDRVVDLQLTPQTMVDENLLLDRAGQLRGNVYQGTVALPLAHQKPNENPIFSQPEETAILPDFVPNLNEILDNAKRR